MSIRARNHSIALLLMLSAELAASASSDRGGGEQDVMMAAEASTRLERGGFIQPALLELPMPLQRRPVHRSRRLYSPLILNSGLRKEYNTTPGVDAAAKNDDVTTANATAKQQHAESHLDGKSYGNITTETSGKSLLLSETPLNKIKVKAVAGVFTGVGRQYFDRRQAVRATWMPSGEKAIQNLQKDKGIVARFVLGYTLDPEEMAVLEMEEKMYGSMIRLDVREKYHNLVLKMRRYMQKAEELYDFNYILKVDDDVYHNPHRLSWVADEWLAQGVDFIGCFLVNNGVTNNTNNKWFEPNAALIGKQFYTYPAGPTYGVSHEAAHRVNSIPDGWLRFFGCGDDCSVASWMMALNVTYHDDRRLCANECHDNAVTVRHGPGLNNPIAELPELHSNPNCSSANEPGDGDPSQHSAVDFRRTNCYQLPSPSDTSFAPCLLRG